MDNELIEEVHIMKNHSERTERIYKHTVKVKQSLKLAKVKVKKSAKKLVIKATLKGKKPFKGKKLTFKFNGKKYTAKTNKKRHSKNNH